MKLRRYLFPSEINEYKPWIITSQALAVFCLVIWGLRLMIPTAGTYAASTIDAVELMSQINLERTQRFLSSLTINSKLITAAHAKANDMLARSYFAHIDPDGNYVWPRIETAGYKPYLSLGENLAMDFTSADEMVSAWMNSPTHRANIVNEKFEDQGLATVAGTFEPNHETIAAVSLFGVLYQSQTSTATAQPPPPPPATSNASPGSTSSIQISKDAKITATNLSGQILVDVSTVISGSPTLTVARLKTQSITLLPTKISGEFTGRFTFNGDENLINQTLTIEARDKAGAKITQDFPVNVEPVSAANVSIPQIPVSKEANVIKTLRIVFGVFASLYMIFLIIDAIIIHRAKIKREGINSLPHILVLLLIVAVNLFANWL